MRLLQLLSPILVLVPLWLSVLRLLVVIDVSLLLYAVSLLCKPFFSQEQL